jgi:hypothetical protein
MNGDLRRICIYMNGDLRGYLYLHEYINPSLTVEKQKNGCKASKINACSRFLFRNDMCYCAIFFTLW